MNDIVSRSFSMENGPFGGLFQLRLDLVYGVDEMREKRQNDVERKMNHIVVDESTSNSQYEIWKYEC